MAGTQLTLGLAAAFFLGFSSPSFFSACTSDVRDVSTGRKAP